MSFHELLAELPSMTEAERQILVRRAMELDDATLPSEHIAIVEERLEEHRRNPESPLSLEQIEARLRSRFPQ